MTNDILATRRYLASVASIRSRVECSESEAVDVVLQATTADVIRTLQATVARLESRVRALEAQ